MSKKELDPSVDNLAGYVPEETYQDELNEVLPSPYQITSWGTDPDVDGLVRRMQEGDIFIPPFQRNYVWNFTQASRFIESLLLGLPVPGIFLAREEESERLLVIDGQQRLRTLQFFFEGEYGLVNKRPFALQGVLPQFDGLTFQTLKPGEKRHLRNQILHATVVRQDNPREDDSSSMYELFERLNTGGTQLAGQEIRACIFHGKFNTLVSELNGNSDWRTLYGEQTFHPRMRDQELILRFLSLFFGWEHYKDPMKRFLNNFMRTNRELQIHGRDEIEQLFQETMSEICSKIGKRAFRPSGTFNAAVFDAVAVGVALVAKRTGVSHLSADAMHAAYERLTARTDFAEATRKATTNPAAVKLRIGESIKEFSHKA